MNPRSYDTETTGLPPQGGPDFDIAVIGLGPAGSALLLSLRPGIKAIAVDNKGREWDELGWRKPCGGLLAPDAQLELARMGLVVPQGVLESPQAFAVKAFDLETGLCRTYPRTYINVDRHRFDLWLASLISSETELLSGAICISVERKDGSFKIGYMKEGRQGSFTARYLVGADGAGSMVRKKFGSRAIRRYVAIQEWYDAEAYEEGFCCFFDRSITDCYAWTERKGKYLIMGAALALDEPDRKFGLLKDKLKDKGFDFGRLIRREGCLVVRPRSTMEIEFVPQPGVFLAGEAAGCVSPSSLEGISYALSTGRMLAEAIAGDGEPGWAYVKAGRSVKSRLFMKSVKSQAIFTPGIRRVIMASGIGSIKRHEQHLRLEEQGNSTVQQEKRHDGVHRLVAPLVETLEQGSEKPPGERGN